MINGEICEMYELEEQIPELEEWKKKFWKITPIKKKKILCHLFRGFLKKFGLRPGGRY